MKTALSILAAVVIALGVQNTLFSSDNTSQTVSQQPAYDRVLKTNTLRCAYAVFPQFLNKDPNTGVLSGVMPDLAKEIEKISGLKIEWVAEIDYGTIAESLRTGKADAFCTGMAMTPSRGKVMGGSIPFAYAVMGTYSRQGDLRFDNAPERINAPSVKIEVNMGDFSEEVAKRFFPKAERVYRSTIGGEEQLFLDVAMKKADVTFSGPSNLASFNKNNPMSALRLVPFDHPIYRVPLVFGVEIHETALVNLLNVALHDLIDNGVMDQILKQNTGEFYDTAFMPATRRN